MRAILSGLLTFLLLAALQLRAEVVIARDLRWSVTAVPRQANAGGQLELHFVLDIPDGIIVYSSDFAAALGPRPARFTFEPNDGVALNGPVQAIRPQRRTDRTFGTEYSYFAGRAEFVQKVRLLKTGTVLRGRINGQTCQEKDGVCTLFEEPFAIQLQ